MEKILKNCGFIVILIFITICSLLTGCTPYRVNKQQSLYNVVWEDATNTDEIKIEILMLNKMDGCYGYIEYNEEKQDVSLSWGNARFSLIAVNYYGENLVSETGDDVFKEIGGSYENKNDGTVYLKISQDNIFNGALVNRDITLKAKTIEDNDYDAYDRTNIFWETDTPLLKFYVYQCYRRFGVGSCIVNGQEKEIVFYWLPDKRFEIFELTNGEQGKDVCLSGSYSEENMVVTLNLETNKWFEELTTICLKGGEIQYWENPSEYWYPKT